MKNNHPSGKYSAKIWITFRATPEEKNRLAEQANITGLSISKYLRRRAFGRRPMGAQADMAVVNELRRIGGLLKHNFETMCQANADPDCIKKQEEALQKLIRAIEKIGMAHQR